MSRLPPEECIRNAAEELNLAWGKYANQPKAQVRFLLGALDWMRRALEQMPQDALND